MTAGGRPDTGNHAQQRRFAAAGGAKQGEQLTGFDVQRQIADDDVVLILLLRIFDMDCNCHGFLLFLNTPLSDDQ